MPGARCARSRACSVESTRVSHHGHTGKHPASPRNGFNGLYRALLGDRACLPPSLSGMTSANLTPASGRRDHTSLPSASVPFVIGTSTSTASRPASVTIAKRPSDRDGMAAISEVIWVWRKQKYFCRRGWTGNSVICPSGNRCRMFRVPDAVRRSTGDVKHRPVTLLRRAGTHDGT